MLIRSAILVFTFLFASSLQDDPPRVTTSLGEISGYLKRSYGGRTFAAFEGVPYAKPPVGSLRFVEPQTVEPWTGTLYATAESMCAQANVTDPDHGEVIGEEDCLYLNVYVPEDLLDSDSNLDTILFIHGGGYMIGTPNMGGPGYLMDRDVVYVNINYRLGILGFLSSEDDVVSGNNGLKDQVAALKWVQSHIRSFGGNPDSVTITGVSAGGGSVHFHYLSPQSKGLFHRAIAHSATAIAPYSIQEQPLTNARRLGAYVGCHGLSTKELIECMKNTSVDNLLQNVPKFYGYDLFPLCPFAPVVEKPYNGAFIADNPYRLLADGKINDVPIIMSTVQADGSVGALSLTSPLNELNDRWDEAAAYILDYNYTVNSSDKPLVAKLVRQFYFGDGAITDNDTHTFITLFGDRNFNLDFERASRMQANVSKSPIYSYIYNYKAELPYVGCTSFSNAYGSCHGDDGLLVYQIVPLPLPQSDERIKEVLVNLVTSFAKTGRPEAQGIDWQPVANTANFTYLYIREPDNIKMVSKKEVAPTDFWSALPIKEYEKLEYN